MPEEREEVLRQDGVKAGVAYGWIIRIANPAEAVRWVRTIEADHYTEVRVEVGDEFREFTMAEFLERLGFSRELCGGKEAQ